MVKLVDLSEADLREQKMQRREALMNFLERHCFVDIHHPPANRPNRKVSFEALSPIQVAQEIGNTDVVEALLEAGAKPVRSGGSSMTLGLRTALSFISSRAFGTLEKQVKAKEMRPSKACLKLASEVVPDDEVQTILI